MKKTFILSALAMAAVCLGAQAKTADELRIYINPGHGSWTADDRPCTLIGHGAYTAVGTDTLSFFESNTNLIKGFSVLENLVGYGLKFDRTLNQTGDDATTGAARDMSNNIVMSRVKNGPYLANNLTTGQIQKKINEIIGERNEADLTEAEKAQIAAYRQQMVETVIFNRDLTEICAEVTANNFDMFISIHSNANIEGGTSNFPLFLYGGFDNIQEGAGYCTVERQTLSKAMADASWGYAFENTHSQWTSYSAINKNIRGDINFYGTTNQNGYLGVLKHNTPGFLVEGYFHTYQPARHRAMNWDVCHIEGYAYARGIADYFGLDKGNKGKIYGIVRDKNEKFKDAAYSPNPTTPDAYKPLNGVKVILKKDGTQVAEYLTDDYYNGAFVFNELDPGTYTVEFDNEQYLPLEEPLTVEVKAASVAYPTASLVNKDWTPPTIVYENYPDVVVPGTFAADEYEFTQSYTDEPIAELQGKTVRRVIAADNKLYILAHDEAKAPTLIVYDGLNKNVLATVSTNGTSGTICSVADIQLTADGVLVASNESKNQYGDGQVEPGETRGVNYIYYWDKDENGLPTGDPKVLVESKLSGNFYWAYVGHTFAYSGTINDGSIIVTASNANSNSTRHQYFFNRYTILDASCASASINNKPADHLTTELTGDITFTTSPLADDAFIATCEKQTPVQYGFDNVLTDFVTMPEGLADGVVPTAFFRYNKHSYMLVPDNADAKNGGVKILDITNGVDKAEHVATVNTSLPEAGNAAVAACMTPVLNADEEVTGAYINLYAVRDGKVSRMTTEGVAPSVAPRAYAYNLKSAEVEGGYNITFKASSDALDANLVLTPVTEGEEVRLPMGEVKKGANEFFVDKNTLPAEVAYTWAVELQSKTIPVNGQVNNIANSLGVRGGCVVMTDPSYPDAFGRIVVAHGKVLGFDVYEADGTQVGDKLFKQSPKIASSFTNKSDPFRGAEYKDHAIFPCWGDKAEGVVAINVADLAQEPFSLFNGTNDGSGNHVLDGVNLGGGSAGACVIGDGENTRLYSFSEDHEGKNGGGASENSLVCYNIGSAWRVTEAPTVLPSNGYKTILANGQADLHPYGNGFFACQNRGAGNNKVGCPSFFYVDGDSHQIVYNSGESLADELLAGGWSFAITPDGTLAAVGQNNGNISFFDVTWEGNVPTMTFRSVLAAGLNNQYNHMRFDYAGNLHAYMEGKGYYEWAVAGERPVVSTPALVEYKIVGAPSGVEDITVDGDNDAPVIYYNMQGVRMPEGALTPGIYIRMQGKTTTKVVIK